LPFAALKGVLEHGDQPERDDDGELIYEILSGHHRVSASIAAGLGSIEVQVTDDPVSEDERRAIQLSHNSISGEDDPAILTTIYEGIQDLSMRLYSGLDDAGLELLKEVNIDVLKEAGLTFQTMSMVFLPDEIEQIQETWKQVREWVKNCDGIWVARWKEYEKIVDAIEAVSFAYGITNVATCLTVILSIFNEHITDLAEGWLDEQGNPKKHAGQSSMVPVATVLGSVLLSKKTCAALGRAINKAIGRGDAANPDEALAQVIDTYLEGH